MKVSFDKTKILYSLLQICTHARALSHTPPLTRVSSILLRPQQYPLRESLLNRPRYYNIIDGVLTDLKLHFFNLLELTHMGGSYLSGPRAQARSPLRINEIISPMDLEQNKNQCV